MSVGIVSLLVLVSTSAPCWSQIKNGDFEDRPNVSWRTDRPNAPGVVPGDRPAIRIEQPNGNRYGFIGDRNGQGANGENPSRIYQRFDCPDPIVPDSVRAPVCRIHFRFRSLLGPNEIAWVRADGNAYQIPNTRGQWAGGVSQGDFAFRTRPSIPVSSVRRAQTYQARFASMIW